MHSDAASIRRDLIQFGIKKRLAGHVLGMGVMALRVRNVIKKRIQKEVRPHPNPLPEERGDDGSARAKDRRSGKVLILEPFGLGDIISFEPLVRELKKRGYEVVLSGRKAWKALYPEDEQLKWIDAELPWSSHSEGEKYRWRDYTTPAFRGFIRRLRKETGGGIGLDTRGDIRSVAVLQLAGCSRVLALENYLGSNLTITAGAAQRVAFDHDLHRWELNLRFLEVIEPGFGAEGISGPFFPHLTKQMHGGQALVGLVPVAPWIGKLWTPEKWRGVIEGLRERGLEVIGLCGPGQAKLAQEQLQSGVAVRECSSIESWADAFNQCHAVVSLDTGPMHLADALAIPVVALFGQGKLPLWAPSNPRSVVLTHQADGDFVLRQPVEENTKSARDFMNRISVEEVVERIAECGVRSAE